MIRGMRLTHIQYLRLPFGPLLSYDLDVGAVGDRLPVSIDQARHVGEGDRPGSWMALSFRLPGPVPRGELSAACEHVVARHGRCARSSPPGPAETPIPPARSCTRCGSGPARGSSTGWSPAKPCMQRCSGCWMPAARPSSGPRTGCA